MNKKILLALSALLAGTAAAVAAESARRGGDAGRPDPATCRTRNTTASVLGDGPECCGPDCCDPECCDPGCCAPACCTAK